MQACNQAINDLDKELDHLNMHLRLRWQKSQGIIKHMDMYVQLMVLFDGILR